MKRLLIITTKEDRSESLLTHEKLQIDIKYYSSALLSRLDELEGYDFVYFRDPFNTEQYDLDELSEIIDLIREHNPAAYYFDKANTLEDMLIEDKWRQAKIFGSLMPPTALLDRFSDINYDDQFVKKRISSRARGVVFGNDELDNSAKPNDYIAQEKLDIAEEYRVIAVRGSLLEDAISKSFKTDTQKVKLTGKAELTDDIRSFSEVAISKTPELDLVGLDVVKLKDGSLMLIEINRSPQFNSFAKFTAKNPFEILVDEIIND